MTIIKDEELHAKIDSIFKDLEFLKKEFNFTKLDRKPTILIVDDQSIYIKMIIKTLSKHPIFNDVEVLWTTSPADALDVCQNSPVDLILLDVEMPEMNGFELLEQLKKNPTTKDISVIFITTHEAKEVEVFSLISGGLDFINKPPNPNVLIARILNQLKLKFQSDLLKEIAYLDILTGIYNRRYLENQLEIEWARSNRNKDPLSIIMLDVDSFKKYNDNYGHLQGDYILKKIASTLSSLVKRPGDIVARFGGEEFMCILPHTDLKGAVKVAEDFCSTINELKLLHSDSEHGYVTVSVGVAEKAKGMSVNEFVDLADKKLYEAKNNGKNCVRS